MIDIFDFIYDKLYFDINKPIRLFEAFSGIGTQAMALKRLGYQVDHVGISEIDKHALKSYYAIHGEVKNYGGIGSFERMPKDIDICSWSFPCFVGDTLVLTDNGNKNIIDIKVGDKVLTHNKTYEKVTNFFNQGYKDIYNINGMAFHELKTTSNHKFYVRKLNKVYNNKLRRYERIFDEPKWIETKDLDKSYYMGVAINKNQIEPKWNGYTFEDTFGRVYTKNEIGKIILKKEFWYIIGRYIADGWVRTTGGIVISSNENKLLKITDRLENLGVKHNVVREKNIFKVHIPRKEWSLFVEQFGYYAHGKKLSKMVLDLPKELIKSFVNGYLSGDGYKSSDNYYAATTTSKQLVYDMAQAIAKSYETPYAIYMTKVPIKRMIERRVVNQRNSYTIKFKKDKKIQDKAFYENGYIWFPIKNIERVGIQEVYDIEVENHHSFLANGTIAHNCQDISLAGKQRGMVDGSRSNYGYVFLDTIENTPYEERPKVLLMENVKALLSETFSEDWKKINLRLERLGYKNYADSLIATDFGVPQTRDRVFIVSIKGEYSYTFPKPFELKKKLKDYLETKVDEKYYLNQKQLMAIFNANDVAINTIKATICGNQEPKIGYALSSREFQTRGFLEISPTLVARDYKDPKVILEPCGLIIPEATKQGYSIAEDGDGIYINRPYQKRGVVQKDKIQTIKTSVDDIGVVLLDNQTLQLEQMPKNKNCIVTLKGKSYIYINGLWYRIRKLTPLEAWRLMGIDDEDFYKAKASGMSDSQLYKQAGNAIVVDVLYYIFKQFIKGVEE